MKTTLPSLRFWMTSLFLLTSVAPVSAQIAPPSSPASSTLGFSIAGTVVNAITGAPLNRVHISIASTRARAQRMEMVTGENGHFEFSGLPADKYSLQGSRRGYLTSAFEQHEQYSTAIVTGPGFATDRLVLRLMPLALITGHVLDESGEGLREAQVRLYVEDHSGGFSRIVPVSRSSTDDRGYFDFPLVQPGTYFVSATASPWYAVQPILLPSVDSTAPLPPEFDVAYPTTYYGGATDSDAASPIDVRGGQTQDVEIRLSPVPAMHFTLRIPAEAGEQNVFSYPLLLKRVFDAPEFPAGVQTRYVSPGVIEISGLAAGRYDLNIQNPNSGESQQHFAEIDLESNGQDLNAGDSETLTKLTIKLRADSPVPKRYAVGLRDSRNRMVQFAFGGADGITFPAVRPGKYSIVVQAQGKFYAVKRILAPTGETVGHDIVVSSAAMEVTAELTEGLASIEGVVSKGGKSTPGIMVALVPTDPEAHVELFRRDQSDFDGTFSLRGVIPGTYTVVAVEDAWGFDWLKAGVLARYVQHGQTVVVADQMRGSIRLPYPLEAQPK